MNQEAQPKKKGFGPLAWIAIGCVGLILVGAIVVGVGGFFAVKKGKEIVDEMQDNPAKSMAEMAIKMNPETKFISSDEETVTFETKDGEVVTMNFEDIREGKFTVTNQDGEESTVSFGGEGFGGGSEGGEGGESNFSVFGGASDLSNVPEQIQYPNTDSSSAVMASKGGGKWSGMFNYTTQSSMDDVIAWQGEQLDDCQLSRTDFAGMRNASFECGGDSVTLTFTGENNVTVTYDIAVREE